MAQKKATRRGQRRRRERRVITHAVAHIQSTYNNTIVTITDLQGNTLVWASGGTVGFKGTKKGTPYAAQLAAQTAGRRALDMGVKKTGHLGARSWSWARHGGAGATGVRV